MMCTEVAPGGQHPTVLGTVEHITEAGTCSKEPALPYRPHVDLLCSSEKALPLLVARGPPLLALDFFRARWANRSSFTLAGLLDTHCS